MEQQIFEFIHRHWMLVVLAVVIAASIVWFEITNGSAGGQKISSNEAVQLMNQSDALIVDVREQKAFEEGHILNAIHLTATDLEQQVKKLNKSRNKPVIVCDQYGQQAAKFVKQLKSHGFEDVKTLKGGIDGWRTENLPLVSE